MQTQSYMQGVTGKEPAMCGCAIVTIDVGQQSSHQFLLHNCLYGCTWVGFEMRYGSYVKYYLFYMDYVMFHVGT